MKKFIFQSILFFCSLTAFSQTSPYQYWQQQVNYKIDVSLNDTAHSLTGFETINYINNSPDTLTFIWFHIWPNAYKNDRTAFCEQMLQNGSTKFYFSGNTDKGYINQLDFKVNNTSAITEDHPKHPDIIKLLLPQPLAPNTSCIIETPFHVKLPYAFSRSGHINQTYHITQWYPKPAVYDRKGWHPMPYLDQGEFYSDFGDFKVSITLPENYIVAATGELQNKDNTIVNQQPVTTSKMPGSKKIIASPPPSSANTKTLIYMQNNAVDFAWFADKSFLVKKDTMQLPSGRSVELFAYYYVQDEGNWKNIIPFIKKAVATKSKWLGEYPYNVVSVVDEVNNSGGGMEYPTITLLSDGGSEHLLEFVVNHEVGHNWFQGILATNERTHPWMDEGINTYYDNRYSIEENGKVKLDILPTTSSFIKNRFPDDIQQTILQSLIKTQKDQPIETPADSLSAANSNFISYTKTGNWLYLLEKKLGKELFDKCMQEYYQRWKFKHPYPEDFKKIIQDMSEKGLEPEFSLMNVKGNLPEEKIKKQFKFMGFSSLKETDKYNYLFASPAIGYNFYDKLMPGVLLHNYTLPVPNLQFFGTAMYGTGSSSFTGTGRINYTIYPATNGSKFDIGIAASSFNGDSFRDSTNKNNYLRFSKIVPALRYTFANKKPRSTVTKYIQWKTFLIKETGINFTRDTVRQIDIISYPKMSRTLNRLEFTVEDNRVLYPYRGQFLAEQGDGFLRLSINTDYFFNYGKGGGLQLRLFAGKFIHTGNKTLSEQFALYPYHLNMTGPKGNEDYTYSNYFYGRNEFEGLASQQIMIRDGGFKVRTDLLSDKIGKTDDWLAAANFTTSIPDKINPLSVLPFKLPIRLFADIGTYAGAWNKGASTGRFLYDAGFQLSLMKNSVNIYFPVLYSKVYKNYFLSTIPDKRFVKNISFSIDVQNLNLRKLFPQLPF